MLCACPMICGCTQDAITYLWREFERVGEPTDTEATRRVE
jgi:hypothetical protein